MDGLGQIAIDVIGNVIAGCIEDLIHYIEHNTTSHEFAGGDADLSSHVLDALSSEGITSSSFADADWEGMTEFLRAPA